MRACVCSEVMHLGRFPALLPMSTGIGSSPVDRDQGLTGLDECVLFDLAPI